MLGAMVAGTALVIWAGARGAEPKVEVEHKRSPETPWLTREAAAQIVTSGGGLGPLFDGVELGGAAPSPEIRERIAAFARKNQVAIDLDVVRGTLASIRFDVTYAGGVGYEGADVLALRFARPSVGTCCGCGNETWISDWTIASEETWAHVRVDVNRLRATWRPTLATAELIDRADVLLGTPERELVADRDWVHHSGGMYVLAAPYPFARGYGQRYGDVGITVEVDAGRIAKVAFNLASRWDEDREHTEASLRERWGRPRIKDEEWTWRRADRVVTADLSYGLAITIMTPAFARSEQEAERRELAAMR
jgi:hypothetical protein